MQIPSEDASNNDIRDSLVNLGKELKQIREEFSQIREEFGQIREEFGQKFEELNNKVEKIDYKFEIYQKGTDSMVRMATTIIIATASVVVLSNLSPAVAALIAALSNANAG